MFLSTVIIVRVSSIKIPVFLAQHRPEREIGTAYIIIIMLLSFVLIISIIHKFNLRNSNPGLNSIFEALSSSKLRRLVLHSFPLNQNTGTYSVIQPIDPEIHKILFELIIKV